MLEELLIALILILIGTKLAGHLCQKIGIPAVIGELMIGIVFGPALLGWIVPSDMIHVFSEIGVILLMFLAGLESDLDLLKKYFKPAMSVALFGIVFPLLFCGLVSHWFGLSLLTSIFIGMVFSATSVSISVQVLREYNRMDSEEGSIILGAAVVDDIVVVLIVSIFSTIMNMGGKLVLDGAFFWDMFGKKVVFFLLIYLIAKFVIQPFLKLVKKLLATEGETAAALVLCFAFAILSKELGMSDVIGAFFMGLIISRQPEKDHIEHKVSTIGYALFIPVFFVSIGLDLDLAVVGQEYLFIIVLSIVAIATKLIGGYVSGRLSKINRSTSWVIGSGMVSRGEMALIIVQMGRSMNLLSGDIYSAVVVAIIVATLVSPLLIKFFIEKADQKLPNTLA